MLGVGTAIGFVYANIPSSMAIEQLNDQLEEMYYHVDNVNSSSVQYFIGDTSLSELYGEVKDSIVVITGMVRYQDFFRVSYASVQGSGFVYEYDDEYYVITNNHVISDASDLVVCFSNGNAYSADVMGADPYSDLAVLSVDAPESEYRAIAIASSSYLEVGDPVVAIGAPMGLDSTMTTGIISQLGRTIEESLAGSFPIANIIQTSVAINPGNSGGPLLNYDGQVVGITTAIIEDSEGLGFAIPSDAILKEIGSLVESGTYTNHSWLGISGVDMNYAIAEEMNVDMTYGWLISYVSEGSAASIAGLTGGNQQKLVIDEYVVIGGDIIVGIDGNRVIDGNYLMSYLESDTVSGQTITLTIIRDNQTQNIPVVLGSRPEVS